MRYGRGSAISRFFEDLAEGKAVPLILIGVVVLIVLPIVLFAVKVHFDMKKEEAAKTKGRKPRK